MTNYKEEENNDERLFSYEKLSLQYEENALNYLKYNFENVFCKRKHGFGLGGYQFTYEDK
jgi:hypothetical protein